jgi:2-oxoacid:acceptor oxidoreductase delta subunit (pyruvate/2-ketoisovalerate family)
MICWKFCPDACIHIEDDKPVIDYQYCKGCVICAVECPKDAISVEKEE